MRITGARSTATASATSVSGALRLLERAPLASRSSPAEFLRRAFSSSRRACRRMLSCDPFPALREGWVRETEHMRLGWRCAIVVLLFARSRAVRPRKRRSRFRRCPRSRIDGLSPKRRERRSRPPIVRRAPRHADAQAVGALARTLHAWEQLDAAHAAYTRARALAPDSLRLVRISTRWCCSDWPRPPTPCRCLKQARGADRQTRCRHGSGSPRRCSMPATLEASARLYGAAGVGSRPPRRSPSSDLAALPRSPADTPDAVTHLERAVALFPELGAAHYALALSYRALGRGRRSRDRRSRRHQEFGTRWPAVDDPALAAVNALRDDARTLAARGLALARPGRSRRRDQRHRGGAGASTPRLVQARANLITLYGHSEALGRRRKRAIAR